MFSFDSIYLQYIYPDTQQLFHFEGSACEKKNIKTHVCSRFRFPNTGISNAIRRLEGNNYLQPTVSARLHVDSIETGSRIEDVTSGEGPEAFPIHERLGSRCIRLRIGCTRTLSARHAAILDYAHAARLKTL